MALPITVPYTFGNATTAIPLSNLDSDYATVYQAVNGIGNGSVALANVTITGGTINVANVTGIQPSTPYTANGVVYASSTTALATGSALTWNGTQLGVGTSSPTTSIYINGAPSIASISIQRTDEAGYGGRVGCGNTIYGPASARSLGLDGYAGISFGIAGSETMRVDSSGNLNIKTSNAGIIFNNSSATANSTLNDYETGTWTPSITAGITGITYANQTGTYTKVGNFVYVSCQLRITAGTTNTSTFTIGGLPFTVTNSAGGNGGSGGINYNSLITQVNGITISTQNNTTTLNFNSFTGITYLGTGCATNGYLYFSGIYQSTF